MSFSPEENNLLELGRNIPREDDIDKIRECQTMVFKDVGYRYRSGAVRYGDLAYVLCTDPDLAADCLPHTSFYAWDNGGWACMK